MINPRGSICNLACYFWLHLNILYFFPDTSCRTIPIGVEDPTKFPNHRMTATSFVHNGYAPYKGRLNASPCWEPRTKTNMPNDYLQLDLGGAHFICAVATQGNRRVSEWTTKYQISLSLNNDLWSTYKESGKVKVSWTRQLFVKDDDQFSK